VAYALSLHHLISMAEWSDMVLLAREREYLLLAMTR
jgi:hypothetical protein